MRDRLTMPYELRQCRLAILRRCEQRPLQRPILVQQEHTTARFNI